MTFWITDPGSPYDPAAPYASEAVVSERSTSLLGPNGRPLPPPPEPIGFDTRSPDQRARDLQNWRRLAGLTP